MASGNVSDREALRSPLAEMLKEFDGELWAADVEQVARCMRHIPDEMLERISLHQFVEQYDRLRSWVGMFRTSPFGREILNLVRCKVTMESIHAVEPASGGLEPASGGFTVVGPPADIDRKRVTTDSHRRGGWPLAAQKHGGVGRQHLGRRGVLVVWAGEGCFSGHPGHDSENGGVVWPWRRGRDHG